MDDDMDEASESDLVAAVRRDRANNLRVIADRRRQVQAAEAFLRAKGVVIEGDDETLDLGDDSELTLFAGLLRTNPKGLTPTEVLARLVEQTHPIVATRNPKRAVIAHLQGLVAGGLAYRASGGRYRLRQESR